MEWIIKTFNSIRRKAKEFEMSEKIEELKNMLAENSWYPKKEEPKKTNPVVIVLAVLGAIAAVAAIAYAVYYFFVPEDSEYFEDFDEDDFDFDDDDDDDLEGDV